MRRPVPLRTSSLLVFFLLASPLYASFEPTSVGARAPGMADAFTAVADDVYSLYYNPSGLVQLTRPELGVYYAKLYSGLTDNSSIGRSFVGYARPLGKEGRLGAAGIDYLDLNLAGLYQEETLGMGYAYSIRSRWNVGGSLKLLRKTFGTDNYTNNGINPITGNATGQPNPLFAGGRSKTALSVDIGTQYQLSPTYALGAVIRDLNSPNMAIGSDTDPVPSYYGIGLARKTPHTTLSVEAGQFKTTQSNYRLMAGVEHWMRSFAVRGGLAVGGQSYTVASLGASCRLWSLQLDYSMSIPLGGIQGTLGNQQVAVTFRFGKPPKPPLDMKLLDERQRRIASEARMLEFQDEQDHIRDEIEKLTMPPAAGEPQPGEETVLEKVLDALQERLRENPPAAPDQKRLLEDYADSLRRYVQTQETGATPMDRLRAIEEIDRKYGGKGLDVAPVRQELITLDARVRQARSNMNLSMDFYRSLVKSGVSVQDRRRLLERILMRYKPIGLDVSAIELELSVLEGRR